ncbi:MAG: HlyD family efflux transporter periplasmic adaptor subunit [Roseburia sp.]|nr:HlyD family efflux transporter periplasmic adaptor subunit [Roseburia sp.]
MKKKIKKFIIFLVVAGVLAGAGTGGVFAYQNYRKENLTAEFVYVSNLNWGFFDEGNMTTEGNITNDYSQNIYQEDKTVKEVLVKEGDSVDVGTPLLVYDTTQEELQVEMKELEVKGIENKITLAKRELERLKKITPVPDNQVDNTPTGTPSTATTNTTATPRRDIIVMQVQQKVGDAYNYIDKSSKPYAGDGTPEEPYRFVCSPECYVTGSYLNSLVRNEQAAAFEIWSGNSMELGTLQSCWTVDGSDMTAVEENSKWLVATQEVMEEEVYQEEEEEEKEEEEEEEEEETAEEIYTVSELKHAIEEKERDLKDLDIDKRKADLDLSKQKKKVEKATVVSAIKGVVKSVADPENPPADGTPFMEVLGSAGIYVQGNVSELLLDEVKVGQTVSVNSWNNGQTYTATISEISEYPAESGGWYGGEGNSNVSYYPFTAYIENPEGLKNGDYVNLSMTGEPTQGQSRSLYIDKAYVREENGKYYVLKVGEDERLEKQYVQTGRTIYGAAIEIKGGLDESDRIAFPYGKKAKEGIRAVESENMY